jgi:uncharacterized protein YjlB
VLRGWRKVDGEPIANPDLIVQLYEHALVRDMTFIKVQAHTSKRGWQYKWHANFACRSAADRLAGEASDQECAARGVKIVARDVKRRGS